MIRVAVLVLALLLPMTAHAHSVVASVFPSGTAIEGEIGFSDGVLAVDQLVQVFDAEGVLLGEVKTDSEGFFLFQPQAPISHHFRADLGAGHIAQMEMSAAEVTELLGLGLAVKAEGTDNTEAGEFASLSDENRAEIAQMLRRELRPIRQELTALRHRNDLQSVLGGIGYILGLFGLGFYLAARRQLKDKE